jgi:hypothetical protein
MQTATRQKSSSPWPEEPRLTPPPKRPRRRFSPLMFVSIAITLVIAIGAGVFFVVRPDLGAQAHHSEAPPNADCTLIVPQNPLTAQGLATPYQLVATDAAKGPCHEANADQAAFVQGAVLDPATGQISIYNPLVIDKDSRAAVNPVVPKLPANAVVGLWFGYNGDNLTLKSLRNSLQNGKCVNGLNDSIFGQFAACNATAFFEAANKAIQAGQLAPPATGMAVDGLPCPTVRDFALVDQDQSDNVNTEYLVDRRGRVAQMTAANAKNMPNATLQVNGSDNRLLAIALDNALKCKPWTAPNLADPGQMVTALPLNELQAAANQKDPIAVLPAGNPMTQVDGENSLEKLNLFRLAVNQVAVQDLTQADTKTYCQNLLSISPDRMLLDSPFTRKQPSPDAAAANNLFTFLAQRFNGTWGNDGGLNCQGLLNMDSPITLKMKGDVAVDATINGMSAPQGPALSCNVNGTVVAGCTGTATINGQSCQFALDKNTNQVAITCPAKQ